MELNICSSELIFWDIEIGVEITESSSAGSIFSLKQNNPQLLLWLNML